MRRRIALGPCGENPAVYDPLRSMVVLVALAASAIRAADPPPVRPKQDANGNPIRYAATGHVSNYDETKVGRYTLPDPLLLRNGQRVRDAAREYQRITNDTLRPPAEL